MNYTYFSIKGKEPILMIGKNVEKIRSMIIWTWTLSTTMMMMKKIFQQGQFPEGILNENLKSFRHAVGAEQAGVCRIVQNIPPKLMLHFDKFCKD